MRHAPELRIGIDAQPLFGPRAGVHRYLATLLDELLTSPRAGDAYRLFGFQFLRSCALPAARTWRGYDMRCIRLFPGRLYFKLLQVRLAFPVDFDCDVYFFPNFVGYPVRRGRTCVTVHDLAYLRYPQFTEPANLRYLRMALGPALRRADHILADSESTARDLDHFFGLGARVSVLPPAVSPVFRPVDARTSDEILDRHGLNKPFLLCVGTIEPRKNFAGMVRAFSALPADILDSLRLVFVGGKGWLDRSFYDALARSAVRDQIRVLRGVADEDLVGLYNRATALILPSFYEGFGLPVVEAMACGCPVIASNVSSLPEVAGEAALLVPPGEDSALRDAVEQLVRNPGLRDALVARGRVQAERYRPAAVVPGLRRVLSALAGR